MRAMKGISLKKVLEFVGKVSLFAFRIIADLFSPPFEAAQLGRQLAEVGSQSVPLIAASGFALGAVMTLHTRSTLVMFGAAAEIPTVQSLAFFVEIGPLVAGLLLAGRVGSGIGAVLANMRVTEQIDDFGYSTNEGTRGVGKAATNSVVLSSLLIIVSDVILVKCIAFAFPGTAL